MTQDVRSIRTDYGLLNLSESDLTDSPFDLFEQWFNKALSEEVLEPNAMQLSTHSADGFPNSRIVLLRGFSQKGFKFYTNYQSEKGKDIARHAKVGLCFFWPELQRQVRIAGIAERTSGKDSDDYFNSRPTASKIGAWASSQSETLKTREDLEKSFEKYTAQFGDKAIERPPHWGGYLVVPEVIEFWQGRPSRLHDRFKYYKHGDTWKVKRLFP